MGFETNIQWCDHTFNSWRGCIKISEGCANCYAEKGSKRNPRLFGIWGPHGSRVVAAESYWQQPILWNAKAKAAGERRRVFCASFADVFEDWQGPMVDVGGRRLKVTPDEGYTEHWVCEHDAPGFDDLTMDDVRDRLFDLIGQTEWLDWMLLTKRPENARRYLNRKFSAYSFGPGDHPLPNLWLGVSVENQATADERIPILLDTPAAVRFVSAEPLLGPIDWRDEWLDSAWAADADPSGPGHTAPALDLVILGGESGPKARPCDVAWIRRAVRQIEGTDTACFVKQLGARPYDSVTGPWISIKGPNSHAIEWNPVDKKGGDPEEWPEEVRVQQMPRAKAVAR